jgi:phosphoglycolate phosphatase-like HAD superfamily hydrolase
VVIGDTPKDVECAHVHGASAIAVATGTYPLKELEKTDAELITADLTDTEKIVDWIMRRWKRSRSSALYLKGK